MDAFKIYLSTLSEKDSDCFYVISSVIANVNMLNNYPNYYRLYCNLQIIFKILFCDN